MAVKQFILKRITVKEYNEMRIKAGNPTYSDKHGSHIIFVRIIVGKKYYDSGMFQLFPDDFRKIYHQIKSSLMKAEKQQRLITSPSPN